MSAQANAGDGYEGRVKHLGDLARIFKHRHAGWDAFGAFLKDLFLDTSPFGGMVSTASGHPDMPCRHNAGGKHHVVLTNAIASPMYGSTFNHSRYSRPCLSVGTFDERKNGGLVVHDLCIRAQNFLADHGYGDPRQETRRDFEYDPRLNPRSSPLGSGDERGGSPDSLSAIDASNIITTRLRRVAFASDNNTEFDDGLHFDEEDVRQHLLALGEAPYDEPPPVVNSLRASSVEASGESGGDVDSYSQPVRRGTSTKMRAATLAYSWGFADQPRRLRDEFRRLRSDATLNVLHLCGDGLCYKTSTGANVTGCAEWSHLILGSSTLNARHRDAHASLNFCRVDDYPVQVRLVHNWPSGEGDGVF